MFISVKEAAELTGKSTTTIYRLCNKRINTEYVKKEDNKFLIDIDFLKATYPEEEDSNNDEIIEVDEEVYETRSTNVLEEDETLSDDEMNAENTETSETDSKKSTIENNEEESVVESDSVLEFDTETNNEKTSSIPWEKIIGVSASLLLIALFIFILSKYA